MFGSRVNFYITSSKRASQFLIFSAADVAK